MDIKPWERQPDEPAVAFTQFLIFRGLGFARSLSAAYALYSKQINGDRHAEHENDPPAEFKKTAKKWDWAHRAAEWDADLWTRMGLEASKNLIDLVRTTVAKLQESVAKDFDKMRPKTMPQLIEAINVLTQIIPTPTSQAIRSLSRSSGPELLISGPGESEV